MFEGALKLIGIGAIAYLVSHIVISQLEKTILTEYEYEYEEEVEDEEEASQEPSIVTEQVAALREKLSSSKSAMEEVRKRTITWLLFQQITNDESSFQYTEDQLDLLGNVAALSALTLLEAITVEAQLTIVPTEQYDKAVKLFEQEGDE